MPRELRALRHYRPAQLVGRLAVVCRRRLASALAAPRRRKLAALAENPPPVRPIDRQPAVEAHALRDAERNAIRARDLLEGCFEFLGERRVVGLRPGWKERGPSGPSHLWRMNLHYHRFLVDAAAAAVREPARARLLLVRAAELLDDWVAECPPFERGGWDAAWNSYSVSSRLIHAWVARRVLDGVALPEAGALRARLDALGAVSAAFLERWLEFDLTGNHLLRNACALVAAGEWFGGPLGDRWRSTGTALLSAQLEQQLLADGFHEERSPMYHALALEDVLLCAVAGGSEGAARERATTRAAEMLGALRAVVHPDGEIALFNDSALGIAPPPHALSALAEGLGVPTGGTGPLDLPVAGYYRFQDGDSALVFDAGPLGPDHLPAHAHCDALSFELSAGGRRIVTDTGVDRYEAGPERDFQRSTAAHSTLQVGDLEQGEPFGSFRMGRRPLVSGRRDDARTVSGAHDGFGRGRLHRRRVTWHGAHGLTWTDRLDGPGETSVVVRLGLGPDVDVAVDGGHAYLSPSSGGRWRWTTPAGESVTLERGVYCERFGSRVPRTVVVFRGVARRGADLEFRLERTA